MTLIIANQEEKEWRALLGEWNAGAPHTGYEFKISLLKNAHLLVEVRSTCELPADFAIRLFEALSFVSGNALQVRVSEWVRGRSAETTYSALPRVPRIRQRFPPVEMRFSAVDQDVRDLFVRYLQFANTAKVKNVWHQCSGHLSHARQASNNSLDAWIVGACVALEGISTLLPFRVEPADEVLVKAIQDAARRQLSRKGVTKALQGRVNGLLSQLSNVRVIDRLRPLAAAGTIDNKYIKAWSDLRNKGVHTTRMSQDDFSDPKLQ